MKLCQPGIQLLLPGWHKEPQSAVNHIAKSIARS